MRIVIVLAFACSNEKPPAPAPPPLDCKGLITAADFATACEAPIEDVKLDDRFGECTPSVTVQGKLGVAVSFTDGKTAALARELFEHERGPDGNDVPVGDAGRFEVGATKTKVRRKVRVLKGRVVFQLLSDHVDGSEEPCSDDGLIALAGMIATRL